MKWYSTPCFEFLFLSEFFSLLRRSLTSPGYFIWNPWNQHWLRPQPVSYSMDIMDSMWNDHGMVMEWLIPHGIQPYSTWIPLDSIWNLCISTLDSMDKSIWIPWNSPHGFHGIPLKFHILNVLPKIVSTLRIEPSAPQHVTCMNPRTLFQLHHAHI